MSEFFPKPRLFRAGGREGVKDLYNYATKAHLTYATGVHTAKLSKMFYLVSLKPKNDKLRISNLKTIPDDLNKLKWSSEKCCIWWVIKRLLLFRPSMKAI